MKSTRGYTGIAMWHPKTRHNWGTLMRTAQILGVDFIATIGQRFPKQASDTMKSYRHVPVFQFQDIDDLINHLPFGCKLVAVETTGATDLKDFKHPERACYLLGAEDHGLDDPTLARCHDIVKLAGDRSMNVAVAGSIVLYHRSAL